MSENLPKQPEEHSDFEAIVAGLSSEMPFIDNISYNDVAEVLEIRIDDEVSYLRQAFIDHVKAAYDGSGGDELSAKVYAQIVKYLNRIDLAATHNLEAGDKIAVTPPGAYYLSPDCVHPTDYRKLAEGESLVGELIGIDVLQSESEKSEYDQFGTDALEIIEPVFVVGLPVIEDHDGRRHDLDTHFVFIPFLDREVPFTKRPNPERYL